MEESQKGELQLPEVTGNTLAVINTLTDAFNVPRDILASDHEVQGAWTNLPRVLSKIPPHLRTAGIARMCVAVATGLFDSAINYAWNAAIIELREKVKRFGLTVVRQVVSEKDFDEQKLIELKDAQLIDLCLKLNLITEDGFFFLDQCRDIRNNFSAAHPAVGKIDDHEFLAFLNRCAKYALGDERNPVGVDIQGFITALKASKFTTVQADQWAESLRGTHEAQRELLFGTLHGIYCDPAISQEGRLNALMISLEFASEFTPKTQSELISAHHDYLAKGDSKRHAASQEFFEKLGLLSLLTESERHALISSACKRLINVHQCFDNFYNEPPFAERLLQITKQGAIPNSAKAELVEAIVTCAVGNPYGVSNAAYPYYEEMVAAFTPAEIALMLELPKAKTIVGNRIRDYKRCKDNFKYLVGLIDFASVPTKGKKVYSEWAS